MAIESASVTGRLGTGTAEGIGAKEGACATGVAEGARAPEDSWAALGTTDTGGAGAVEGARAIKGAKAAKCVVLLRTT